MPEEHLNSETSSVECSRKPGRWPSPSLPPDPRYFCHCAQMLRNRGFNLTQNQGGILPTPLHGCYHEVIPLSAILLKYKYGFSKQHRWEKYGRNNWIQLLGLMEEHGRLIWLSDFSCFIFFLSSIEIWMKAWKCHAGEKDHPRAHCSLSSVFGEENTHS